ncbi:MAG: DUF885 domain-containing protein, partial [Pseudomonadales bacterium]|nr:DUF885 domain-containing protein [Pseudomonadales bacterium]
MKSIGTVLALGLPAVTSAQSTTAVNPDLSISIPVLSSNGQRTTGMLKILELRDQAESALGDLYDIK